MAQQSPRRSPLAPLPCSQSRFNQLPSQGPSHSFASTHHAGQGTPWRFENYHQVSCYLSTIITIDPTYRNRLEGPPAYHCQCRQSIPKDPNVVQTIHMKNLRAPLWMLSTLIPSCLTPAIYPFLHLTTTTSPMAPQLHMPSDTLQPSRQLDLDTKGRARLPGEKANENGLIQTMMTPLNLRTVMPPQRSKMVMGVAVQVLGTTRNRI